MDDFANLLLNQGYTRSAGRDKLRVVLQLNQWLEVRQLPLQSLDEKRMRAFQTGRRRQRRSAHGEVSTLALLLDSLRCAHVIPAAVQPSTRNPLGLLIGDYEQFLQYERGLSQKTLAHRIPIVRHFLSVQFKSGLVRPNRLRAQHISHYILREARNQRQDRAQLITGTLRSFLDFLWQRNRLTSQLRQREKTT